MFVPDRESRSFDSHVAACSLRMTTVVVAWIEKCGSVLHAMQHELDDFAGIDALPSRTFNETRLHIGRKFDFHRSSLRNGRRDNCAREH
jgi:hypothetical protein